MPGFLLLPVLALAVLHQAGQRAAVEGRQLLAQALHQLAAVPVQLRQLRLLLAPQLVPDQREAAQHPRHPVQLPRPHQLLGQPGVVRHQLPGGLQPRPGPQLPPPRRQDRGGPGGEGGVVQGAAVPRPAHRGQLRTLALLHLQLLGTDSCGDGSEQLAGWRRGLVVTGRGLEVTGEEGH